MTVSTIVDVSMMDTKVSLTFFSPLLLLGLPNGASSLEQPVGGVLLFCCCCCGGCVDLTEDAGSEPARTSAVEAFDGIFHTSDSSQSKSKITEAINR